MDESGVEAGSTPGTNEKRAVGRPRILSGEHLEVLAELARETPVSSRRDIARAFKRRTGLTVSPGTLRTALGRLGFIRLRAAPAGAEKSAGGKEASVEWVGASGSPVVEPAAAAPSPGRAYGYTDAHRDMGDDERYPSDLTDPKCALVRDLFETNGPRRRPKYPRRAQAGRRKHLRRPLGMLVAHAAEGLPAVAGRLQDVSPLDRPGQVRGHARPASRDVARAPGVRIVGAAMSRPRVSSILRRSGRQPREVKRRDTTPASRSKGASALSSSTCSAWSSQWSCTRRVSRIGTVPSP
jgi:hypothetical protein